MLSSFKSSVALVLIVLISTSLAQFAVFPGVVEDGELISGGVVVLGCQGGSYFYECKNGNIVSYEGCGKNKVLLEVINCQKEGCKCVSEIPRGFGVFTLFNDQACRDPMYLKMMMKLGVCVNPSTDDEEDIFVIANAESDDSITVKIFGEEKCPGNPVTTLNVNPKKCTQFRDSYATAIISEKASSSVISASWAIVVIVSALMLFA